MPKKSKHLQSTAQSASVKEVAAYEYAAKRRNNPEVGLVTPDTDPEAGKTIWAFDPHLAPELHFDSQGVRQQVEDLIAEIQSESAKLGEHAANGAAEEVSVARARLVAATEKLKKLQAPFLAWSGAAERTSFEVDTVSLHVHEKIDSARVIQTLHSEEAKAVPVQGDLFDHAFKQESLREAVDFYKHERGWSNRLVAGDSLLVMNSLLRKEGMAGQVQMVYFDPPYGIKYGSNIQPFLNKRDVKDRTDSDLTQEPEMIKAFRDTWELGIHSYLTYLRDRLLLARELLHESGSVFVQISDENVHLVRNLMDEVFGGDNFVSLITYSTTGGFASATLSRTGDYVIWYSKNINSVKYRQIYTEKDLRESTINDYDQGQEPDGYRRALSIEERRDPSLLRKGTRVYTDDNPTSQGTGAATGDFEYCGLKFHPGPSNHWKAPLPDGMKRLSRAGRFYITPKKKIRYVRFLDDFNQKPITNAWFDIAGSVQDRSDPKVYVVQTSNKVIERCLLMATDPSDLVMDITCGSGTTAFVAEKWGRRWITCDTSRVALALAKQRLMTASFDYYALKYPNEGVRSGFIYQTVPHITLKSIANNPEIDEIHTRLHPGILAALEKLKTALKQPKWQEWDVPFAFAEDWPEKAREPFDAFHKARQTMQARMDASIAAHADREILYDRPQVDKSRVRVTGPFTVEATPFPAVQSLDEAHQPPDASTAVARSGETSRQHQWRDELVKTGIRGKGGQKFQFADMEPIPGTRHLHAIGSTVDGQPAAISFGPEHAPLEQRQVALALEEAMKLMPKPKFVVFASFAFDSEAAKDIDEINWPGVTLLKAQMNPDLLTEDLKKGRASNESFWLMGQPDVEVSSGQWVVDSVGAPLLDPHETSKLSRLIGVAKIHGLSQADVSRLEALAARGTLRPDEPSAQGRSVGALEHSGGAGTEHNRRVSASPGDCEGVFGGSGDADDSGRRLRIPDPGGSRSATGTGGGNQQDAALFDAKLALQKLRTAHYPLTTAFMAQVKVNGFDYFNTKTGDLESGGAGNIAMWLLDPDYDGRALFPRQIFFPMAGDKEGWARLSKDLKAQLDEERLEAFRGTISLPFEPGDHRRVAVKVIDDRGIESLKVINIEESNH